MTIKEKISESNDALSSLLTYVNGVTGAEDTNIGDAIKTLCDGFGQGQGGSGSVHIVSGEIVFDSESSAVSIPIQLPFDLGDHFIVEFSILSADAGTKKNSYIYLAHAHFNVANGAVSTPTNVRFDSSKQNGLEYFNAGSVTISQSGISYSTGRTSNKFMAGVPYVYVIVAVEKPIKEE